MTKHVTEWTEHEVRLFPSVHISGEREAELRATAALLAAMRAVSEFGRKIVRLANAPAGQLSSYTEIPFKSAEAGGAELRPDGVIVAERGKTRWMAFVEVKVGAADLDQQQIDKYHRLARNEGANALITVSNQPARPDGTPPLTIDRRRNVPVMHFSWERLLSEAQVLSRKKEVSDPDQKWMLDEWIRYVEDTDSRIIVPPDLGPKWREVVKAARTSALDQSVPELQDVARYWVGYLRKAAFRLRAKLGVDVEVRLSRKEREDSELQAQNSVNVREGILTGVLRIPDAAGDITIRVILASRSVQYAVKVAAPTEGRQMTRVNWLSRYLKVDNLPTGELLTTIDWNARGLVTSAPARDYLEETSRLCVDKSGVRVPKDASPRFFQVVWTTSLSSGRGRSTAPILEGVSNGLEEFYHKVVQEIVPFVPKAPRLDAEKPELDSTDAPDEGQAPAQSAVVNEPGDAERSGLR